LNEKPRLGRGRKLDGKQEAFLVVLACTPPSEGRTKWSTQRLADRMGALGLVDESEVLFVLVPPTPSAKHLLNREQIGRLRKGALVAAVTRAHAIDMTALRERILTDEPAGAFDVYDIEPLPADDPLRGRANVVHTPHVAGRTRDANLRVADVIADDFARILRGEAPVASLTREAMRVRTVMVPVPAGEDAQ
jgi:phosphoglycerate dehydrogenase-like enzyme